MASIQTEELVCPQPPCFKPLKFLGPSRRQDEQFLTHIGANASFDENLRVPKKTGKEYKKNGKCSLLKFLEAKAQRKQQKQVEDTK